MELNTTKSDEIDGLHHRQLSAALPHSCRCTHVQRKALATGSLSSSQPLPSASTCAGLPRIAAQCSGVAPSSSAATVSRVTAAGSALPCT